ncbi:peptidase S41-like protein [Hypnocyclicus thermotrophus]|uniref:Peptidase S41-like protein n=1 Tax=Hypnocyclicus thermotrophus TaxID=1627895 RepID=A0AA46DZ17_9FUSO|nr:S41 family peptidase [Hypnocyclicus thermotrophus]TDT71418.1 peptidase S41-like protein [Hypnocyclicus thermotrophus]
MKKFILILIMFIYFDFSYSLSSYKNDFILFTKILETNYPLLENNISKNEYLKLKNNILNNFQNDYFYLYKSLNIIRHNLKDHNIKINHPTFIENKLLNNNYLNLNIKNINGKIINKTINSNLPFNGEITKINNIDIDTILKNLSIYESSSYSKIFPYSSLEINHNFSLFFKYFYGDFNSYNITYKLNGIERNITLNPKKINIIEYENSISYEEISNDIAYIKFYDYDINNFNKYFEKFKYKKNLIIDIRNNFDNTNITNILSYFIKDTKYFYTDYFLKTKKLYKEHIINNYTFNDIYYKKNNDFYNLKNLFFNNSNKHYIQQNNNKINRNYEKYNGKIYILENTLSENSSIDFSIFLKKYCNAVIIGEDSKKNLKLKSINSNIIYLLPKSKIIISIPYKYVERINNYYLLIPDNIIYDDNTETEFIDNKLNFVLNDILLNNSSN